MAEGRSATPCRVQETSLTLQYEFGILGLPTFACSGAGHSGWPMNDDK